MEHVFDPVAAFREIGRTLKPGGAHIFTTPIVLKHLPTTVRARLDEGGGVVHLESPVYHGNPIDSTGALVTFDWGFDITSLIFTASGLFTDTLIIDDLSRGIRAEYIEVFVTSKPMEIAE